MVRDAAKKSTWMQRRLLLVKIAVDKPGTCFTAHAPQFRTHQVELVLRQDCLTAKGSAMSKNLRETQH